MKRWLILIVLGFFLVYAASSPFGVGAKSPAAKGFFTTASATPSISYAEWIGKNLRVEGENFSEGASVLVDGPRIKSSNDENYPSAFVYAKKAKKKVTPNQVITLQARNPDGATSSEFTFYSGFVITRSYSGRRITLR